MGVIFRFLINFCMLMVLFSFVWKYLVVLPYTLITAWNRFRRFFSYVIIILGYYLSASLMGLVTLGSISETNSITMKILIGFLGLFFYFSYAGDSLSEKNKQCTANGDYESLQHIDREYVIFFISLILFLVVLFFRQIAINPLTLLVISALDYIYSLSGTIGNIIRFVLTIVGGYNIIAMAFGSILILISLISAAISPIFSKKSEET